MRHCFAAGLVEGKNLAVDGTTVGPTPANKAESREGNCRKRRRFHEVCESILEQANPVSDTEIVSTTDPDATYTTKGSGRAMMAYYDNYLIDTTSRVILGVEATQALFDQEAVAARKMLEGIAKLGIQPESLGADKGYGSGEFLAWLLEQGVQPHIDVIDRRHQTGGRFTQDQFRYDPALNVYHCPEVR